VIAACSACSVAGWSTTLIISASAILREAGPLVVTAVMAVVYASFWIVIIGATWLNHYTRPRETTAIDPSIGS